MRKILAGFIVIVLSLSVILSTFVSNIAAQTIEDSHFKTRNTILSKLTEYIKCQAAEKSITCDSLSRELKWLTDLYTEMYGVRDLSLRFMTYSNWSSKQARRKLSLDWIHKWLSSYRNNTDASLFAGLDNLTKEYTSINDSFHLAVLLKDRGQLYVAGGEIDSAVYNYRQCIKMCRLLDYFSLIGNCEMLLGRVYNYRLGDYLQSELAYSDAIRSFRRVDEQYYITFAQLGRVYDLLQLYKTEAAIRLTNSFLPGLKKSNDLSNQAQSHYFLAVAYNNLGMLDSALFHGSQSLRLREMISGAQGLYLEDLGYSMTYMGQILQALGNREQALIMYKSADSVLRIAQSSDAIFTNLIAWGNYLLEMEEYNSAKDRFDQVSQSCQSYEVILAAEYGLAVCDYYLANSRSAMERLKHCIWLIENTNRKLPVPEMKTGILSDKIGYFNLLACMYIEKFTATGQNIYVDSALHYLEKSKSRAFIDNLMKSDKREIDSVETRILRQISEIYKSERMRSMQEDALREIHNLEDSLLTRYLEKSGSGDEIFAEPEVGDISIETLQNHMLVDNTVLMQYLLSHFGNYLFVISRGEYAVVKIDADYHTLHEKIGRYLELINSYPASDDSFNNYKHLSHELYSLLIPESELLKAHRDHLLIVASGPLHYLPLESLMNDSGDYLVEKYCISYAPSMSAFDLISHRDYTVNGTPGMVVFANSPTYSTIDTEGSNNVDAESRDRPYWDMNQLPPLVSCSLEVKAIENCFGSDRSLIYARGHGTEDNFKQVGFKNGDYLHISAHGMTDERNPDRSAILLAADEGSINDGFLRPKEIMRLRIPARLVFLSSCRSGTGKSFPGEGVLSLARPFIIAGCQAAIATYWNISDLKSAEFVEQFYKGVREGDNHAKALAVAKRSFINSKRARHRHPYFWAPFVLIGQ